MKVFLIVVVLVGLALPVSAQNLKLANAVYSAGMITDWIGTRHGIAAGLGESNPLSRPFVETDHPGLIAAGAAIDVGVQIAINHALRHHPKWRAVALYGGAAFRIWCGATNVVNARRLTARRTSTMPPIVNLGTEDSSIDTLTPALKGSR